MGYTENTGSPKPSTELDLLTQQLAKKVSIFACEKYEVYSDVAVSLGGSFVTKKVTDVKVDPDAVFVPERLRDRIQWMPRTTNGIMLQNCRYVDYGFFGNLEVLTPKAFGVLVGSLDTCYT